MLIAMALLGCVHAPPDAPPALNEALVNLFVSLEWDSEGVGVAASELDVALNEAVDVAAKDVKARSFSPLPLSETDLDGLDHPDASLRDAIAVGVAGLSAYPPSSHAQIQLLDDQTAVEPFSPEYYERTFLDGDDCFPGDCDGLRTWNDLVKQNFLMEIPVSFNKDFRCVDLDGEPAMVGRSWMTESAAGDGATVVQSYTVEAWLPAGEGTLRVIALWSETVLDSLSLSDEQMAGLTAQGLDDNITAGDDYLETQ